MADANQGVDAIPSADMIESVLTEVRRVAQENYALAMRAALESNTAENIRELSRAGEALTTADKAFSTYLASGADLRASASHMLEGNDAAALASNKRAAMGMEQSSQHVVKFADYVPTSKFMGAAITAVQAGVSGVQAGVIKLDQIAANVEAKATETVTAFARGLKAFAKGMSDFGKKIAATPEKIKVAIKEKAAGVSESAIILAAQAEVMTRMQMRLAGEKFDRAMESLSGKAVASKHAVVSGVKAAGSTVATGVALGVVVGAAATKAGVNVVKAGATAVNDKVVAGKDAVVTKAVETKDAVVTKVVETKQAVVTKAVDTKDAVVGKVVDTKDAVVGKVVETEDNVVAGVNAVKDKVAAGVAAAKEAEARSRERAWETIDKYATAAVQLKVDVANKVEQKANTVGRHAKAAVGVTSGVAGTISGIFKQIGREVAAKYSETVNAVAAEQAQRKVPQGASKAVQKLLAGYVQERAPMAVALRKANEAAQTASQGPAAASDNSALTNVVLHAPETEKSMAVIAMLNDGANPNAPSGMFASPLSAAITQGNVGVTNILLDAGAKVDARTVVSFLYCSEHKIGGAHTPEIAARETRIAEQLLRSIYAHDRAGLESVMKDERIRDLAEGSPTMKALFKNAQPTEQQVSREVAKLG